MNAHNTNNHWEDDDLGPLADLPTIPATRPGDLSSGANTDATNQLTPAPQTTDSAQDAALLRLLRAIIDQPGLPSSKYPKLAGMSSRKAVAARHQLVEQKLIRETELQTKARGRSAIVLTPTDRGTTLLSEHTSDTGDSKV